MERKKAYIEANPLIYGYLQYREYTPDDIKHIHLMNFSYNILFESKDYDYITSDYAYRETYVVIRRDYGYLCDMRFFAFIHRIGARLNIAEVADDMHNIRLIARELTSSHLIIAVKYANADYFVTADTKLINKIQEKKPIIKRILGTCPEPIDIKF
ncbi:MAG: hypothetical protein ACE5KT_04090 [Methanosarcinales archaeon]